VAAGTIGAGTWAQAGPPPPAAGSSAVDVFLKANSVKSENVVNGSLFFKDFHKGEVPSLDQLTTARFNKAAGGRFAEAGELATVKGEVDSIRGDLGSYVKSAEADARYLKLSDSVVRGDGSVFSASRLIPPFAGKRASVMEVPGLLAIEAENGTPRLGYVVNETGGPLFHTACGDSAGGGGFNTGPGVVQPGQHFHCQVEAAPVTIQLFGEGADPLVVTLTFSSLELGQTGEANYTAQILVGA
jgi:hypothetical protein